MKKIKVAYVLADISTGGVAKVLENITNNMDAKKYDQYIISLTDRKNKYDLKGHIVYLTGIGNTVISKSFYFLRRLYLLRKLVRKYEFDVVIALGAAANILSLLSGINGTKIISEHNVKSIENKISFNVLDDLVNGFYNRMIPVLYNVADVIVPVSKIIADDLIVNFGVDKNKIHVIYNGVDSDKINELSLEEEFDENNLKIFGKKVIVNVGAVSVQKGQWHIIRIMPQIRKVIPDVQLVILGDGAYMDILKKLCKKLNVADCVHFFGRVKNPYKYMKHADVFVLSSLYEGFPNVMVEALALGLPIVSTDCPSGPREILMPDDIENISVNSCTFCTYGVLTPTFSIDGDIESASDISYEENELLNGVVSLLTNDEQAAFYSKKSLERAKDFTVFHMANEYASLIK